MTEPVRTTCAYCGVGCGVLATPGEGYSVEVKGDPEHPANFGRLCSKGSALGETVDLDGRLLYPQVMGERVTWDTALNEVAGRLRSVLAEDGPQAVAFYVSGQLLTEDYYVANKLMKGFIGSANIDTNSRLCMSSSVAGHKRAFGSDTVPGCYEDLELAELTVLVGSNAAWCHPVLFQRMRAAKEQNPGRKVIVIDPRRTQTCDIADLHLPLQPGTDTILFNGLLNYLVRHGEVDFAFLEGHTEGYAATFAAASESAPSIPAVALACGLEEAAVAEFYHAFASTTRVVTAYSQGVNQSSCGTDKVNSIINCHLATGRIGRPGMGPLSLTGQPNAMGGREVGGLANQLAAHMDFDDESIDRVRRFWDAPNIVTAAGLKAVDMFRAIEEGRIKAVWIMATNPVVSMPDADRVRAALQQCPNVFVSDVMRNTDTTACAHVLLPALAWGEKEGTVTNSERRISRQRQLFQAPGEARPDWWIISRVAQAMGHGHAFDYHNVRDVFVEHAALSAFENDGQRDFDLGGLKDIGTAEYARLAPVQWPYPARQDAGTRRLFGDGHFFTASGRARFVPITPVAPHHATDAEYPLVLNTGRVRDHWHTLTRTGKSPRLSAHVSEPFVEVAPRDAARFGVKDNELARIRSRWGGMVARVRISSEAREGSVFVPMHWNEQFAATGRVDALVNPVTDPVSGQPELKHTPVHIEPFQARWYGYLVTQDEQLVGGVDYWVKARRPGCWNYDLAGCETPLSWDQWLAGLLDIDPDDCEWSQYRDSATGLFRCAVIDQGRLIAYLYVSPELVLPARDWLFPMFSQDALSQIDRLSLLFGKPAQPTQSTGRIVCSCFGVGEEAISRAVRDQGCQSAQDVGKLLKAGTNCGSCVPEIKALIARL